MKQTTYSDFALLLISMVCIVILSAFLFSGCSLFDTNDSEPEIDEVPFEILRQSANGQRETSSVSKCTFNSSNIDMSGQDVSAEELSGIKLVISRPEDFEHYLTCDDDYDINLETHLILAGMTTTQGNGVHINDQRVIITNDTLRYNVEIWDMLITIPDRASYMVKVPNAYRDYPVDFNIYWREER